MLSQTGEFGIVACTLAYKLRIIDTGFFKVSLVITALTLLFSTTWITVLKKAMACIVEIRKNREYDRLPIIVYAGHFTNKLVEETFRSGANLYLAKTNSCKELVSQLKKIFSVNWEEQLFYPPQTQFVLS